MGIPRLQTHYCVLHAAVLANLTPSIAIPMIFAFQLAGGRRMKTAVQAAIAGADPPSHARSLQARRRRTAKSILKRYEEGPENPRKAR